jgi:hypothetical protein
MAPGDNEFHWDMMSMFSGYVCGLISFKFPASIDNGVYPEPSHGVWRF